MRKIRLYLDGAMHDPVYELPRNRLPGGQVNNPTPAVCRLMISFRPASRYGGRKSAVPCLRSPTPLVLPRPSRNLPKWRMPTEGQPFA
jgi:hypothetical protein